MPRSAKESKNQQAAFSVKIPPDLLKKVRQKSAETGVAIAFVIRKALEEWVNKRD